MNLFMTIHTPLKTKYVRANDGPFMTKDHRKLNKNKTIEADLAYKQ